MSTPHRKMDTPDDSTPDVRAARRGDQGGADQSPAVDARPGRGSADQRPAEKGRTDKGRAEKAPANPDRAEGRADKARSAESQAAQGQAAQGGGAQARASRGRPDTGRAEQARTEGRAASGTGSGGFAFPAALAGVAGFFGSGTGSDRRKRIPLGADIVALLGLAVILVIAFLPTYGPGWLWVAVLGSTLLGMALALVSQHFRWNVLLSTGALVASWLVFGSFLAMPDSAMGYVLPTARTLRGLLLAPVTAWRDMLTIAPPLGTTWNVMAVPAMIALVSGFAGLTLARRSRLPVLAWMPTSAGTLIAYMLGMPHTLRPILSALAWVGLVVIWTTAQRAQARRSLVQSRVGKGWMNLGVAAVVLAVCAGATVALAPLVRPSGPHASLRQVVERPLNVHDVPSPLQGFRANFSMHNTDVLFAVDGAPAGSKLRLATMDVYDGMTFNASNAASGGADAYERVGASILDPAVGDPSQVSVAIRGYEDLWLPTVDHVRDVTFTAGDTTAMADALYYNIGATAGIVSTGLREGDVYTLDVVTPIKPSENDIRQARAADVKQPDPIDVPDRVRDLAMIFSAGSRNGGEAAYMIAHRLSSEGWFSHGVTPEETKSLPGHSYSRLYTLVENEERMVGDDEQFAAVMALMCRSVGIPSRVAYGYAIPGDGVVRGADAVAWVEVALDGLGWVAFEPTPDPSRILKELEDPEQPQTRPHVENPPPPPERPEVPPAEDELPIENRPAPRNEALRILKQVVQVGAMLSLPLVVLIGPGVLIMGLKLRRRKARMTSPDMGNRVAGGWAELLDAARDLGATISPHATRSEQASTLGATYANFGEGVDAALLAHQADTSTFSPDPVEEHQATSYWQNIDQAIAVMRSSVSKPKALLARMSTRSFKRFMREDEV